MDGGNGEDTTWRLEVGGFLGWIFGGNLNTSLHPSHKDARTMR
jgi:hypothetical protein